MNNAIGLVGVMLFFAGSAFFVFLTLIFALKDKKVIAPIIMLAICFTAGLIMMVSGNVIYIHSDEIADAEIAESDIEKNEEQSNDVEEVDYEENIPEDESEDSSEETGEKDFLDSLKEYMDSQVAENAYNILKNDIGFENLSFENKMGETTNYKIKADGSEMVLTASDQVYRIFIPNSQNVFYEDGSVKMTASEYKNKQIEYGDDSAYYIIAQTIIKDMLKNPSSAKFPSIVTNPGAISMQRNGALVAVQSYVDATNSFNAVTRSTWTVEYVVYDLKNWSYEPVYIEIDGQKSGEFIKMEDWKQP